MNYDKIKARLESLKTTATTSGNKNQDIFWKPQPGKQTVRLLPYVHDRDFPFIELNFYYDFGKTFLAPSTFGEPDPIVDFCNELRKTKQKEDWKLSKKLEPKFRTYVAVLVRGQESEGPKFWGFGKQIYQDLLSIIEDPDYGDITDLKSGRDVTIEYIPSQKDGTYPSTKILAKPNVSVATTDVEVIDKIKNIPNITTLFTKPDYDTLKDALQQYLNPATGNDANADAAPDSKVAEQDAKSSKSNPALQTTSDVEAAFDELFNTNDLPF